MADFPTFVPPYSTEHSNMGYKTGWSQIQGSLLISLNQRSANFSYKGSDSKSFSSAGHMVSRALLNSATAVQKQLSTKVFEWV